MLIKHCRVSRHKFFMEETLFHANHSLSTLWAIFFFFLNKSMFNIHLYLSSCYNNFNSQSRRMTGGLKPAAGHWAKKLLIVNSLHFLWTCSPYRIARFFWMKWWSPPLIRLLWMALLAWNVLNISVFYCLKFRKYIFYFTIQLIRANTAKTQGQGEPLPNLVLYLLPFWHW